MVNIPMPPGIHLFPYQQEGIEFLVKTKNSYLTDEMGLGKTIQVIGFTNLMASKKVLVVCPASLKLNWVREFERFSTRKRRAQIIKSNATTIAAYADLIVVSYDTLRNGVDKFRDIAFDLIVLDESHYIKNMDAQRTRAVIQLEAPWKIALTGTPILNRPAEIFATVNWLQPGVLGEYVAFLNRHCSQMVYNPYTGSTMESWRGAHHVEELRDKLYASVMLRRRKEDVLPQLPEKTRQVIEVEGLKRESEEIHRRLMQEFKKVDDLISALQFRQSMSADFLHLLTMERHKTALEKVPHCAVYITELLESRDKIVVFAHHRDVIESLRQYLVKKKIGLVTFTGEMNDEQKNQAVQQFQHNDAVQVFIGSIRAAGTGITLTSADLVLFLELDYTPAVMLQAEDRTHRIGQRNNVLIQYFVFKNGLDAMIVNMLIKKLEINNRMLGDEKMMF
jgi:SWI/SNF-related matrix-associated actin-dependent regulator of chromatin subfamily A-like protein 1